MTKAKTRKITVNIREGISKETVEFLMNCKSFFLFKHSLSHEDVCHNAGSKQCVECEEPECDSAKGWKGLQK